MPTNSRPVRMLAAAALAAAISVLAPAGAGPLAPAAARADGPAPTQQQRQYEIRYMEFTIDHHAMGVQMAMIGLEKATDPRLIDISQTIIEDQGAEIELLQGYLRDWYGITYEPRMTNGDMRMLDRLASLDEGEEFDVAYSEMFIRHHAQIIDRSEQALSRVYHPELRQFAQHVITEQTGDIVSTFIPVLISYGVYHWPRF